MKQSEEVKQSNKKLENIEGGACSFCPLLSDIKAPQATKTTDSVQLFYSHPSPNHLKLVFKHYDSLMTIYLF